MELQKAKKASTIAWVLYAVSIVLAIAGITERDDYAYVAATVLIIIAGAACIAGLCVNGHAMKLKKRIAYQERKQQYHQHLHQQHPQPYSKVCESCGAQGRVVPGQVNKCEYCGSFLDKV